MRFFPVGHKNRGKSFKSCGGSFGLRTEGYFPFLDIKEIIAGMKTKFEIVDQMFHGFDYKQYFKSENNEKLKMEQKNIAFELLRKLLNDEVKIRKRKNMTQGKKFSEMLENVIKRYHNNQIDTAQVIQELSEIAREMKLEDKKAEDIGLSPEEYAFYSVLAENDSTKFLEDHKMKELIHVIVDIVRTKATLDWEKMESKRAELRLAVKKALMRYGYPPDLARIEADRVLEQSELLASELIKE